MCLRMPEGKGGNQTEGFGGHVRLVRDVFLHGLVGGQFPVTNLSK